MSLRCRRVRGVLHICYSSANTYYFLLFLFGSHSKRCEIISRHFDEHLWWLVVLYIFSHVCWPCVYHLWKNVYRNPVPILSIWLLDLWFWVVRIIDIFWTLMPFQIYDLNLIFFPNPYIAFHSLDCALWCAKVFKFDVVSFTYFSFCCFWCHI